MEATILSQQEQEYLSDWQEEIFLIDLKKDGYLYLVNKVKQIAYRLPEKYSNTPFYYSEVEGLI